MDWILPSATVLANYNRKTSTGSDKHGSANKAENKLAMINPALQKGNCLGFDEQSAILCHHNFLTT